MGSILRQAPSSRSILENSHSRTFHETILCPHSGLTWLITRGFQSVYVAKAIILKQITLSFRESRLPGYERNPNMCKNKPRIHGETTPTWSSGTKIFQGFLLHKYNCSEQDGITSHSVCDLTGLTRLSGHQILF